MSSASGEVGAVRWENDEGWAEGRFRERGQEQPDVAFSTFFSGWVRHGCAVFCPWVSLLPEDFETLSLSQAFGKQPPGDIS